MRRPLNRITLVSETNNGPSSPSLNLLDVFSVQRRVRTNSRAGPPGILLPRHAGEETAGERRRQIF